MDSTGSNWQAGPSGEWLERIWNREDTLPSVEGESLLPPGQYMPEVLPIVSPSVGAGALYLKLAGETVWIKYLGFAGAPWDKSGSCPVHWSLSYLPRWKRPRVDFVAAPDVSIWKRNTDPYFGPEPLIAIIRAGSIDWVPEQGQPQPLRIFEVLGSTLHFKNGVNLADLDVDAAGLDKPALTSHESYLLNEHVATDDPITVQPMPNRVLISHDYGQWTIEIAKTNPHTPGGFVYQILPVRKDEEFERLSRLRGDYSPDPELLWVLRIRVVHNRAYDIRVTVEHRGQIMEAVHEGTEWFLPDTWTAKSARVELIIGEVELRVLPTQGDALPDNLPPYVPPRAGGALQVYGPILETAIGFVPVAGTVMDVLHLTYMATYRETFWGEKASDGDIIAQAVFTLVGVFGEAADAARLVGLEKVLFTSAGNELFSGAKLVTTNPGWVPWLKEILLGAADPHVVDVVKKNRGRMLDALEEYVRTRDSSKLIKAFNELVTSQVKHSMDSGAIPDRMVALALESIHPADLDVFEEIGRENQQAVLRIWNEALGDSGRSFDDVVQALAPLHADLNKQFKTAFSDWRMLRVFSNDVSSFRLRLLDEGFRSYKARGGTRNAVQWAGAQRSGKYYEMLVAAMGPDFKDIVRGQEEYWQITQAALSQLGNVKATSMFNFYDRVRAAVTGRGLGQWFQVDHVLEQRFIRNHPVLNAVYGVGESETPLPDVSSVLVPRNKHVGAQLNDLDFKFPYVHAEKTALMQKLVPHGEEMNYNLREMFDAHVIVMRHQLEGPVRNAQGEFFESVLKSQFMDVVERLLAVEDIGAVKLALGVDGTRSTILGNFRAKLDESLGVPPNPGLPLEKLLRLNPRFRKP
jgi:hypothetical protein